MEPRLEPLLAGAATPERPSHDSMALPPLLAAPQRLHLVLDTPPGSDAGIVTSPERREHKDGQALPTATPYSRKRAKPGAPLAEVLNDEAPKQVQHPQAQAHVPTAPEVAAVSFSGRLSDILIDPSQHTSKRRKLEPATQATSNATDNAKVQLPKPVQPSKKATRRPRIPPLLQGLHQPPPLPPQDRLFPPITGEASGFRRERVGLPSPVAQESGGDALAVSFADAKGAVEEPTKAKRKQNDSPVPRATSDKENKDDDAQFEDSKRIDGRRRELKKRNKWSDEETKALLLGVSKFGIGNWKKILLCPELSFNSRTAVDLKDRFRTCCPGQGLKTRKPPKKSTAEETDSKQQASSLSSMITNEAGSSQEVLLLDSSAEFPKARKARADREVKSQEELEEMGLGAPFMRKPRRERREFTERDDENLLKGFQKYGSVWHNMRDDPDLGFESRRPTDLRDRFRIRYRKEYERAGYKPKPKDGRTVKEKGFASSQTLSVTAQSGEESAPVTSSLAESSTITPATSASNLRAHAISQPLSSFFPESFDDFPDLISEYDGEGNRSPITLSRTILHWADANPSSTSTAVVSSSISATAPAHAGDHSAQVFTATDGLHIDPRATFQIPSSSHSSMTLSGVQSQGSNLGASAHALSASASIGNLVANMPGMASSNPASSKHSMDTMLLRTPNLPTIVYPHVPVASARNTMHNLPRPADLLSGVDIESRNGDAQQNSTTAGFFDDTAFQLHFSAGSGTVGTGLERSVLNSSI